jgi:PAS domain S-box-containing protein
VSLTEEPGLPKTRRREELREGEELYRLLAEHSTDMISKHTPGGLYTYASPACRSLLGYDPEDLVGRDAYEFFHPDDLEAVQETHSTILERPDTHAVCYRIRRKDDTYTWFETTSRTVRDPKTDEVLEIIAVSRDVTERKRAEESLREIREAERRRIARDLHDVVLQDLAGALQGMQAAQVESEKLGSGGGLEQEIAALRRAVGGLRNAIYDLRFEKEQPFVRAVESLVELNRQLTPEREIRLTVRDGFPPELSDDADVELLRVLQEALVNARRHSAARRVEVSLSRRRRRVRAEVADDGKGFDPASVREGLGISGMRERALALGGKLEIESAPGKGTSVTVEAPLSSPR